MGVQPEAWCREFLLKFGCKIVEPWPVALKTNGLLLGSQNHGRGLAASSLQRKGRSRKNGHFGRELARENFRDDLAHAQVRRWFETLGSVDQDPADSPGSVGGHVQKRQSLCVHAAG